jgi:hypothetical protein
MILQPESSTEWIYMVSHMGVIFSRFWAASLNVITVAAGKKWGYVSLHIGRDFRCGLKVIRQILIKNRFIYCPIYV